MSRMPRIPEVAELVSRLSLTPHPEGGWYRETHRSAQLVHSSEHGERAAFTSILFLLEAPQVSRFHRIDAEELWNWHAGSPLDVQVLAQSTEPGQRTTHRLGPSAEECFQAVVPAGSWFAAEVASPGSWSLVGCVVAPGFEFRRFEMADREALLANYPREAETVLRLTPIPQPIR
jgi:predicted cupin superfamily sugar epimerase